MSARTLLGILISCSAGFIGGLFSSHDRVNASAPELIRAREIELVGESGIAVARWSTGSGKAVSLKFLNGRDASAIEIGLLEDGRPFLSMAGRDGKRRIMMDLDQADKPMLGMSDERWEGRVRLGFIPPDTFPYSNWDHWGILFRAFGSQRPIVGMGTVNRGKNPAEPFLTISGKKVR